MLDEGTGTTAGGASSASASAPALASTSAPSSPALRAQRSGEHTPSPSPKVNAFRPKSPFFRSGRGFARLHPSHPSEASPPAADSEKGSAHGNHRHPIANSNSPHGSIPTLSLTAPHHHRLALSLWGGRPDDLHSDTGGGGSGRATRASGRAGEELDPTTAAQISSIRSALHGPSQIVRVVDAETGEVFELHLNRSDPYAVPTTTATESRNPSLSAVSGPHDSSPKESSRVPSRVPTPKFTPTTSGTPLSSLGLKPRTRPPTPEFSEVAGPTLTGSPSPRSSEPVSILGSNGIQTQDHLVGWLSMPDSSTGQDGSDLHSSPRRKMLSRVVPRPKSRSRSRPRASPARTSRGPLDGHANDADDESVASRGAAARSMVSDLRSVEAAQAEDDRGLPPNSHSSRSRPPSRNQLLSTPEPIKVLDPERDAMIPSPSPPQMNTPSEPDPDSEPVVSHTMVPMPSVADTSSVSGRNAQTHGDSTNFDQTDSFGSDKPRRLVPRHLYTAPEDPLLTVQQDASDNLDSSLREPAVANSADLPESLGVATSRPLVHPVARHGGLVLGQQNVGRPPVSGRSDTGWSTQSGDSRYSTASESGPDDELSHGKSVSATTPVSALDLPVVDDPLSDLSNSGSEAALPVEHGKAASTSAPTPSVMVPDNSQPSFGTEATTNTAPQQPVGDPPTLTSSTLVPHPDGRIASHPKADHLTERNLHVSSIAGPQATETQAGTAELGLGPDEAPTLPAAKPHTHPHSHVKSSCSHPHVNPLLPPRGRRGASVGSMGSMGESILSQSPSAASGLAAGPNGVHGVGTSPRRDSTMSNLGQGSVAPQHRPRPSLSTIYTGDAAFDEEANRKAELLRRQRRAKAESEEASLQSPISPATPGFVTPTAPSPAVDTPNTPRRAWSSGPNADSRTPAPPQLIVTAPTSPLAGQSQVVDSPVSTSSAGEPQHPSVGKIIDEHHANYALMYNMLTGIRISVSRFSARPKGSLTPADYHARHRFTFDIIGNELAPANKSNRDYDFKFKDYAPMVFRDLRELFHLDAGDYLLSLTSQYILSELGSPGKSGSFFYFSGDYRFIIKTISHNEHRFFLRILPEYYEHVRKNPHTLLSRFYGLHRVKLPHGRKIHFVVMANTFPPHRDIHETYDLKGSLVGREYPEAKAASKKGATIKDINWLRRARHIELEPDKNRLFQAQLRSDIGLLQRLNIMDYSLLIGLHDLRKGNSENLRQEKLSLFQPRPLSPTDDPLSSTIARVPTHHQPQRGEDATALRQAVQQSDPRSFDHVDRQLPDKDGRERLYCVFYQEEGGFRSTSASDNEPGDWIYYFSVIDLFTPYTPFKRAEHLIKSIYLRDRTRLSPIRPRPYGQRFLDFMRTITASPPVSWPGWRRYAAHPTDEKEATAIERIEEQVHAERRVPYESDSNKKGWWPF